MVNGLEFYQRKEIKDILAYLHLLNNPRDNVAFLRVINTPPRGIGKSTIEQLVDHAAAKAKPLLDAAREAGLIESLAKRAAVAVAKFVAIYDRLSVASTGPVEEIMRHVLAESGYQLALQESDDEEDQERLANIEELLTAAREFDEQNPGENRLEGFLEAGLAGQRHRRLGGGRRPRDADDVARLEGAGISGRVRDRRRGRAAAARTEPRVAEPSWKRSGGCCSSA